MRKRTIQLHAENISNIICMHKVGMHDQQIVAHITACQKADEMRRHIARLEWQLGDMEKAIDQNKVNFNLDGVLF